MTLNPGVYSIPEDIAPEAIVNTAENGASGGEELSASRPASAGEELPFALITGGSGSLSYAPRQNARNTLLYLKRPFAEFASVSDCAASGARFNAIILATPDIREDDTALLSAFLKDGSDIVFAELPLGGENLSDGLRALLGVIDIEPDYEVEGFQIYEGIFLGDMFTAYDWTFGCARVFLSGTCRVFANGQNPERDKSAAVIAREDQNPIIWRNSYENGMVFVINAPFMQERGGIGVLTGILSILNGDFIYPVINAKTVVLEDFPYIAEPDRQISSRTVFAFERDIIWPDLISIALESNIVYTCVTNGEFYKNYESSDILHFFASEMYKALKSNIGCAISPDSDILALDASMLRENFSLYEIRSYKLAQDTGLSDVDLSLFPDMTALLLPRFGDESFMWVSGRAVALPTVTRGINNERESFDFVGILSSLGLSIHALDMALPVVDEDGAGAWNTYAVEIAKYFSYLFSKAEYLRSETLDVTAELSKDFLNSRYEFSSGDNFVAGSVDGNAGELSFFLRTEKTVTETVNCSAQEIDDGAYLITSSGPEFEIRLK